MVKSFGLKIPFFERVHIGWRLTGDTCALATGTFEADKGAPRINSSEEKSGIECGLCKGNVDSTSGWSVGDSSLLDPT